MGSQRKGFKIGSMIWLIIIQIVALLSVMLWFIGWVMSFTGEVSGVTIFVTSYPVFVIVSIIMGWITFAKKRYLQLILWSVFPIIWWLIFSIL